jgi:hypothetical protein
LSSDLDFASTPIGVGNRGWIRGFINPDRCVLGEALKKRRLAFQKARAGLK